VLSGKFFRCGRFVTAYTGKRAAQVLESVGGVLLDVPAGGTALAARQGWNSGLCAATGATIKETARPCRNMAAPLLPGVNGICVIGTRQQQAPLVFKRLRLAHRGRQPSASLDISHSSVQA